MLRYKLTSPIRLLLPISIVCFILPVLAKDVFLNVIAIPLLYFMGSYFIFINFPTVAESLHAKPIYIEDLILKEEEREERDDVTFKRFYSITLNVVLACLFAACSEYVIMQGIRDKPVLEILGIIGGNLSLYFKVQNSVGKMLLCVCHSIKRKEENKRENSRRERSMSRDGSIEMSDISRDVSRLGTPRLGAISETDEEKTSRSQMRVPIADPKVDPSITPTSNGEIR